MFYIMFNKSAVPARPTSGRQIKNMTCNVADNQIQIKYRKTRAKVLSIVVWEYLNRNMEQKFIMHDLMRSCSGQRKTAKLPTKLLFYTFS